MKMVSENSNRPHGDRIQHNIVAGLNSVCTLICEKFVTENDFFHMIRHSYSVESGIIVKNPRPRAYVIVLNDIIVTYISGATSCPWRPCGKSA